MRLGVQTHFAQGWNVDYLNTIAALGIEDIRDELLWQTVEQQPGVYTQSLRYTKYMDKADDVGVSPLIELGFANSLYDQGYTPYTEAGRQAFVNYALSVLRAYDGQIQAVEVWNEYNGGTFVNGPVTADRDYYYTEMLKDLYTAIKAEFPDVMVIGASTVTVPLPYIESLFQQGALDYMDAISVHPYRNEPEGVEVELAGLKALMDEYGEVKPIYATEFGHKYEDSADASGYLVKMATLMASEGVEKAYWYLFRDYGSYTNMGLYNEAMRPNPALAAYQFLQENLSEDHTPSRESAGTHRIRVYDIADDLHVVWGLDNAVAFSGNYTLYDARGTALTDVTAVSDEPFYVRGDFEMHLDPSQILADTKADFQQAGWSYFARSSSGKMTALVDGVPDPHGWDVHLGLASNPYLTVSPTDMFPGWNNTAAVQRYTASETSLVELRGEFGVGTKGSNGVVAAIALNGQTVWSKTVLYGTPVTLSGLNVKLHAGDTLDIVIGSNGSSDYDSTAVHVALMRTGPLGTAEDVFAACNVLYGIDTAVLHGTADADVLMAASATELVSQRDGQRDVFVATGLGPLLIRNYEAGIDLIDLGHWDLPGTSALAIARQGTTLTITNAQTGASVSLAGAASVTDAQILADITLDPVLQHTDVPYRHVNLFQGGAGADMLTGTGGRDSLIGLAGDDVLDGGGGGDTMSGGPGNDRYVIDSDSDVVTEAAGGGSDLVTSSISYTLGANVENLTLLGARGLHGVGNGLDNAITGSAGADTLEGLAGNDTLTGGGGDDRLDGGEGTDTAALTQAFAAYALKEVTGGVELTDGQGAHTTLVSIETVRFADQTLAIADLLDRLHQPPPAPDPTYNTILGTDGGDRLRGTAGADLFIGKGGDDRLLSSADGAADVFVVGPGEGNDRIFGFELGIDRIDLGGFGLSGLGDPRLRIAADGAHLSIRVDGQRLVIDGGAALAKADPADIVRLDGAPPAPAPDPEVPWPSVHTITGTDSGDQLRGTAGADVFIGKGGDDRLLSSADGARDVFVIGPGEGNDRIFGFEAGIDRIDLGGFGLSGLDDPRLRVHADGAHLAIRVDGQRLVVDGGAALATHDMAELLALTDLQSVPAPVVVAALFLDTASLAGWEPIHDGGVGDVGGAAW